MLYANEREPVDSSAPARRVTRDSQQPRSLVLRRSFRVDNSGGTKELLDGGTLRGT